MKRLSFVQWAGWLFVLSGLMTVCLAVYAANNVAQQTRGVMTPRWRIARSRKGLDERWKRKFQRPNDW